MPGATTASEVFFEAEIAWSRTFLRRLEAGDYWFAEDGPPPGHGSPPVP